jgi:starch synthase
VNANQANGFVFEEEHPRALLATLQKALLVFRDKKTWLQLQLNGMQKDFSWQNSARAYQQLYQQLL